jgi:Ser/Thr protein kinase RdoA (MazF antagonist)
MRSRRAGYHRRMSSELVDPPSIDSLDRRLGPAFGLEDAVVEEELGNGLINRTWRLRDGRGKRWILQQVSGIFRAEINLDIDAVTRRLHLEGMLTPRLVPTPNGELWVELDGQVWRLLTYIEGITHSMVERPEQARRAGRLLGRFHRAVADLEHELNSSRLGVHDTAKHLEALRAALRAHVDHAAYPSVRALASEILTLSKCLPALPDVPDRVVHGDPKIANILFDRRTGEALCLIDLDTLARMPVALELGDAFRSWCNPRGEDAPAGAFSMPLFEAAVSGYAEATRGWLRAQEWEAIPGATLTIALELAARFCADALNESYFAWDTRRFASASAHNQARARSQLAVAAAIHAQRQPMQEAVAAAFG